jgi:hypothetical protein
VFNGARFRSEIAPRIADFVLSMSLAQGPRRDGNAGPKARKVAAEVNGTASASEPRNITTPGFAASKVSH